jgi:hypothetical protein
MTVLPADADPVPPLAARLLRPQASVPLGELPGRWFRQTVEVVVAGQAGRAGDPALPGRIRGAWGHALMRGASAEALAGRPCPWAPPCALDVFFRDQARLTAGLAVPRPYVLAVRAVGADLAVRLTVFGFACDWIDGAGEALTAGLRDGDPLGRGLAPALSDRTLHTAEAVPVPEDAAAAELTVFSPLRVRDGADGAFGGAAGLVASLGNRVSGLARWQDAAAAADWRALVAQAETLRCDDSGLDRVRWTRRSARQGGRAIPMQGLVGRLVLEGRLGALAPLLALGATCHAGSHTAIGLGGYDLTLW